MVSAKSGVGCLFSRISLIAGVTTLSIGILVLVGWIFDIRFLTSLDPGFASMKVNAAIGIVCLSVALLLSVYAQSSQSGQSNMKSNHLLSALLVFAILIASLTFAEYLSGIDFGIDQIFCLDVLEPVQTSSPGRPSMLTALGLGLLAFSLSLLTLEKARVAQAQMIALLVSLSGLFVLVGYILGASALYSSKSCSAMSLLSAVSFIVIGLGVFFLKPGEGIARAFTADSQTSRMLRRIVPILIILPIAVAWLRQCGEVHQLYNGRTGLAIMVWSCIALSTAAVCFVVGKFHRVESDLAEHQRLREARHSVTEVLARRDNDSDNVLSEIFNLVCQMLDWDVAAFWRPHAVEQYLYCSLVSVREGCDFPQLEAATLETRFASGEGLPGRVWSTGKPAWIDDVTVDSNFPRATGARIDGIHAGFAFPVVAGDTILGVVEFFSQDRRDPDEDVLLTFQSFGSDLGQYLSRAMLERQFEQVVSMGPDALVISNRQGEIVLANSRAADLFGYPEEGALVGASLQALLPDVSESGKRRRIGDKSYTALRQDGSQFVADVTSTPLDSEKGVLSISAIRDVTEAQQKVTSIKTLNRQLSKSNQELEDFAYVASHDLQEPLRAVVGYTSLLEKRYAPSLDDQARKYVQGAQDGARRMQILIEDLLSYSRVDSQGKPLENVDLKIVFASVIESLEPAMEEAGAQVLFEGELPVVLGDRSQLYQLFQNLISNALKFRADSSPVVSIETSTCDKDSRIIVSDNGIGFDMEYKETIFMMFKRLHTREEYPGTGIGLAICKKIVDRHGGSISVESEPGIGTKFIVGLRRSS